jgi:hypothetical protein
VLAAVVGGTVVAAAILLPVAQHLGVGGLSAAQAAPVDPTPRNTPKGKPTPTPTSTAPDPTSTATSQPPSTTTATSTATSTTSASGSATSDPTDSAGADGSGGATGSGGSTGGPSVQSAETPSATSEPQSTGRATTPTTAGSPNGGGGNGGAGGNGNGGGSNGNGGGGNGRTSSSPQVSVDGRKVAAPTGDGRSSREVDAGLAGGTLTADRSPTSSASSPARDSSTSSDATSSQPGPDRAEVPSEDDAIPATWRLAAVVALAVGGLAVALLIAAGRPRSGTHRRH